MTYFELQVAPIKADNDIVIDGVTFPETSSPIQCTPQLVSDGGRLADNIDYEGSILGVKHTIVLKYEYLNKQWFDIVYNATMRQYELNPNKDMFFNIKVPTHTPLGIYTFTCYLGASSFSNSQCVNTTEYIAELKGDSRYGRRGSLYDELHENIEITFIEK